MSRYAALVQALGEGLRRRGIETLSYFHTDHFEPWRSIGETVPAVGDEIVDSVHEFVRATERLDFARRLTLFYKPHLNYALRRDDDMSRADPDDLVGFLPRTEAEERFGRAAMHGLATDSAHEIQLHIHHEYYTATTIHRDPDIAAWFATPLGRKLDGARLELAIRLNREIIARETDLRPERWFFVHGQWALNASDDRFCVIANEIEILLRNGCRGDFTFPAVLAKINPRIAVPYLCRPVDAPKGYDRPEAEPEIAWGNRTAAQTKFFVWASAVASGACTLDYMSGGSRRRLEDTEAAAHALIDTSYAADGQLFIKTHAHSMHQYYFEHARTPIFPHLYPPTQTLLSVIFAAADAAGVEIRFVTASEVYDAVVGAAAQSQIDLVAAYQGGARAWVQGLLAPKAAGAQATAIPRPALQPGPVSKTVQLLRRRVVAAGRGRN